jgi:hypothetical protein
MRMVTPLMSLWRASRPTEAGSPVSKLTKRQEKVLLILMSWFSVNPSSGEGRYGIAAMASCASALDGAGRMGGLKLAIALLPDLLVATFEPILGGNIADRAVQLACIARDERMPL